MGGTRVVIRVVLTREATLNDALRVYLPEHVDVVEVPATMTHFRDVGAFDDALRTELVDATPKWLVLTSARAAAYAARAVALLGEDVRVACVGSVTARAVRDAGVRVDLVGQSGARALGELLDGVVLVVGALEPLGELETSLSERAVANVSVPCYETVARELSPSEQLAIASAHVIFVGAPSAWRVVEPWLCERALVVVPGETTAAQVGGRFDVMAGWNDQLAGRLRAWITAREKEFGQGQ